ncbi:MAG: hypothetical protein KBT88_05525 [Gammaproteobacteria bacterium]|nr:hypothetical protein [Gammaproteobacteria bacterium]MBQ0839228.1 hypothetical protein [Gammaproteobacteria bacterium]
MQELKWRARFMVKPSLAVSETFGDYQFELLKNGTTVVEREYQTSAYDEIHPNRNSAQEYAEQTLARLDAKKIREILLKQMIYQRNFSPISVELEGSPELTNRSALIEAGAKLRRTIEQAWIIPLPFIDGGGSIRESQFFWDSGFKKNHRHQQDELLRIADWLERSHAEQDIIQSFILAWIAFNGLYSLFWSLYKDRDNNDLTKFTYAIEKLISAEIANGIVKGTDKDIRHLATLDIFSNSRNTNYSEKLGKSLYEGSAESIEKIDLAVKCIYGVRGQVFHEAPVTSDIEDRVKSAKSVLLPIVEGCLKEFIYY